MKKDATDAQDSVVASYLKRPYTRLLIPEDDNTFRAEMLEFPGCIATGDSSQEALTTLEDVAASWLGSALAKGQPIPEPIDGHEFSGRLVVRLPKSLHKKASLMAERDGTSLNQLIVTSLAEYIGERALPKNANTGTIVMNTMLNQVVVNNGTTLSWNYAPPPAFGNPRFKSRTILSSITDGTE